MSKSREYMIAVVVSYITVFFNIVSGIVYSPWMLKKIGSDVLFYTYDCYIA